MGRFVGHCGTMLNGRNKDRLLYDSQKCMRRRSLVRVALGMSMGVAVSLLIMSKKRMEERGLGTGLSRFVPCTNTLGALAGGARSTAIPAIQVHQRYPRGASAWTS